jgi:hypothetical protein
MRKQNIPRYIVSLKTHICEKKKQQHTHKYLMNQSKDFG